MISSISASPANMATSIASLMSTGMRASSALSSTPSQPIVVSPLIQQESKGSQKTTVATVNSKETVQASNTQNAQQTNAKTQQETAKEAQNQQQLQQVLSQLKARDTEVRAHEMAHLSAAGGYATGMNFTYQTGPDGKQYAVGGEVGIDTSGVSGDPEATLLKAQVIQQAALAPAQPSDQDRKVAAAAQKMMADARAEIAKSTETNDMESKPKTDGATMTESSKEEQAIGSSEMRVKNADLQARLLPERGVFDIRVSLQQALR